MSTSLRRRRSAPTNASASSTSENKEEASSTRTRNESSLASSTEMGYMLLSECSIVIGPCGEATPTSGAWIDVDFSDNSGDGEVNSNDDGEDNSFSGPKEGCSHCNLVFHPIKEEKAGCAHSDTKTGLRLFTRNVKRFQATVADMTHCCPLQDGTSCQAKQRSDAALLLGAILDAQDHGYVAIQTLQLLIHEKPHFDDDANKNENNETMEPSNVSKNHMNKSPTKASLLVTLAFPALTGELELSKDTKDSAPSSNKRRQSTALSPIRSIVPLSRRNSKSTTNLKPLPTSVQFLLSIVKSDWNFLESQMQQLQKEAGTQHGQDKGTTKNIAFFPQTLSLEELYTRIRGSNSRVQLQEPEGAANKSNDLQQPKLLGIHVDILKSQIAPFLRAKSLNSLRCTCKSLHQSLQMVVPGLKLRLFRHQIKSLQWMRHREIRPICEARGQEMLLNTTMTNANSSCLIGEEDNDLVRAMSGGQSAWLCPRWNVQQEDTVMTDEAKSDKTTGKGPQWGIRIDQTTGNELLPPDVLARKGARGGLLCDDPGLGKTITIISLILQTLGVQTELEKQPENEEAPKGARDYDTHQDHESPEERMFQAYWKEDLPSEFRGPALNRLLKKLKMVDKAAAYYFLYPVNPEDDGCEDYLDIIQNPICFTDILKRINANQYGNGNSNFNAFVEDVELCFRNAMEYNPEDHEVYIAARKLLGLFQTQLLVQFKKDQLGSLRSSSLNAGFKPNSSVAALANNQSEADFQRSLLPSSATLLVIPFVLMDHWQEQIQMHVDFRYTTKLIPLIYEYTPNRKSALGMEEAVRLCQVDKTHFPLIFIDKAGTHKLPSPEFLAMFKIVITTTRRFTNEWKNGSFKEELERKRQENEDSERDGRYVSYRLMEYGSNDEEACPLLKINWLRMVVDEGHAMGRGKGNSAILFASWITAQRRWAMTGTPTKQTASNNDLKNMNGLMHFLQHDFFSRRRDGDIVWKRIARNWKDGHLASFYRLKSLLSLLMIRHTKLDIEELPPPVYSTTVVPMSPIELTTYNTLVAVVQANIQLTTMEGKTSGKLDSLLHRSQAKHAQLAVTNIRRVCCGEARVYPTVKHEHWIEFMDMCMIQHKMPDTTVRELEQFLHRATSEQLSRCHCCGMMLSMLLVMPCGCLVCTECLDNERNVCIMCDKPFDVDEFQLLQPGFVYEWRKSDDYQYHDEKTTGKATETNPAVVVQENPNNDADEDEDPTVQGVQGQDQLMLRPPAERRRTRKLGDGHVCEYSRSFTPGICTLCFEPHDHCKLVNENSCCPICFVAPKDCPEYESKSHYLVNKLLELYKEDQKRDRNFAPTAGFGQQLESRRRLKVIVFTQFRQVSNLIGNHILKRFGTACMAEYFGTSRAAELHRFKTEEDCFILLLGKDGSEGLDLSFVTHLFFLEAIWNKSLEHQVVARGWRMGASAPLQVETLLAKATVEEQMQKLGEARFMKDIVAGSNTEKSQARGPVAEKESSADFQRGKIQYLLKSLKLVPDVELVPLPNPELVQKRFGPETAPNTSQENEEEEQPQAKKLKRSPTTSRVTFDLKQPEVIQ